MREIIGKGDGSHIKIALTFLVPDMEFIAHSFT